MDIFPLIPTFVFHLCNMACLVSTDCWERDTTQPQCRWCSHPPLSDIAIPLCPYYCLPPGSHGVTSYQLWPETVMSDSKKTLAYCLQVVVASLFLWMSAFIYGYSSVENKDVWLKRREGSSFRMIQALLRNDDPMFIVHFQFFCVKSTE